MRKQCVLIYTRVRAQIAAWDAEGRERSKVPMLSTWLNQKRFDEAPTQLASAAQHDGDDENMSGSTDLIAESRRMREEFQKRA
jgi:hypothetical protein